MIEVQDLHFAYRHGPEVLLGIDLIIRDGEFVAIMGENGAGKTTLVKTFNGLLRPTRGTIKVDGVDTRKASVAELSRLVGLVFQNPDHQLFSETVEEEIAFALRNFGFADGIIDKRVDFMLETLGLSRYRLSSPFTLSGGERKRVSLGAVLAWDPKHLVLDEPTIGQDYQQKERLRNFITQLNTQGKTVVIVSHDIEFVAECKPRVVLMASGRILVDGEAEKVLTDREAISRASLVMPQIAQLMDALEREDIPANVIDVYEAYRWLRNKIAGE